MKSVADIIRSGTLYYSSDAFEACEAAVVQGEVSQVVQDDVRRRFVVGPVADTDFYDEKAVTRAVECGPCESLRRYDVF